MPSTIPTEQKDRTIIVDVIRGFALIGVLIANFTSYSNQQTPEPILHSISSPFDSSLMNINAVFLEWKFFTLFSILFGYGFGLILESLTRKNINPVSFFIRRMMWLFVFGIIHTLFWTDDVLHLYAMSGILLLLFYKKSNRFILISSIIFMFVVPFIVSFSMRNFPDAFGDKELQQYYQNLKSGNILVVFRNNIEAYYRKFILSGGDLHDISQTLGRFLLGYYLLRLNLFNSIEAKKALFKKVAFFAAPIMIAYFILRWLLIKDDVPLNEFVLSPLLSIGIFSTTSFYVSMLVISYISFGKNKFFTSLEALGRMTLTNYLMVSAFLIILLYGIGFNKLGELPMHTIWMYALGWLFVEIIFSTYWLKYFRYGPTEWIWRQLSYRKRLELRK